MSAAYTYPQKITQKEIDDMILVTEHNRKDMIKLGRHLIVVDVALKQKTGAFTVFPCMRPKSWMSVKGDLSCAAKNYNVFTGEGEDHESWKNSYDAVITDLIKKRQLFVSKKLTSCATFSFQDK